MRTSGRTVLIAGATVVIGMMGLLVLRQPLLTGVAVAAAATVAMVLLGSLTLLPALLGFSGTRLAKRSRLLGRRRDRSATAGRSAKIPAAQRWAGVIQRRPVLAAVVSTGILLALAAPALGMKLNFPDESSQARGTMGYASYATMARGFGPGFDAPVIVAAALPSPGASTARLAAAIGHTPGVAAVTPAVRSADGKAAMLIAYPATGEQDPATNTLVNHLSTGVIPAATAGTGIRAYLTGPNAGGVAFANLIGQRLLWLIAVVVLVSMLLLTVMFRSVTIAVKAAVMNLLSICAAYGVLVAITQDGVLRQVFGFPENVPVTTWVPIFLFVILFGLSMDYEVFLLSRIRESYDATGDNAASVAFGLGRTARVITAAAAIMIVVFLSFVAGAQRLGEADRPGPGGGRAHRRHPGADGAGAGGHGTARQGELVAARPAGPGAAEDLPARGRAPGRGPGPDPGRRVAPGGPGPGLPGRPGRASARRTCPAPLAESSAAPGVALAAGGCVTSGRSSGG